VLLMKQYLEMQQTIKVKLNSSHPITVMLEGHDISYLTNFAYFNELND
jgi:hypothetical protein